MIRRDFIIDLPHILRMRMLIMSCPCALFESKLCITSKKRIKQFGFFLEICSKSIFVKNWGNTGYFLLSWKDFSTDQYVLELVDSSINFLDKREQYLSLDASMETPSKF